MSDIEENKRIAQRFLELVGEHKVEELCEMIAPTWTMHRGPPALPPGPEGLRELFRTFGQIEQTWTIEDIIAKGDKVAVRATNTCLQERFLHWIVDGKIRETWRNADDLGRLLQLGARIEPAPTQQ